MEEWAMPSPFWLVEEIQVLEIWVGMVYRLVTRVFERWTIRRLSTMAQVSLSTMMDLHNCCPPDP